VIRRRALLGGGLRSKDSGLRIATRAGGVKDQRGEHSEVVNYFSEICGGKIIRGEGGVLVFGGSI